MILIRKLAGSNISEPQDYLEASVISYSDNQPADPDLWDDVFFPILLIRVENFLSSNIQNITYSLLRIGTFIKQHSLGNKPVKDFLKLANVGAVAW